jgi:hypothetical protein
MIFIRPDPSSMTNWTRIFIKTPCVPVDCRQLLESPGYRTLGRLAEASVGENVPRCDTKLLVVQAFIQQLLDLTERPCRVAVGQPLGVGHPRSGARRRLLGSG